MGSKICAQFFLVKVRLFYLEGWRIIEAANEVFGFNGWSHSVIDIKIDYEDVINSRYSMGASAIVRVTLKDGAHHEDIGYGFVENACSKGLAYSKVKKAAVTDATKRALKSFGEYLGNCMYDREYIEEVIKYGEQSSRARSPQSVKASERPAPRKYVNCSNTNSLKHVYKDSKLRSNIIPPNKRLALPRDELKEKGRPDQKEESKNIPSDRNDEPPLNYQLAVDANLTYLDPDFPPFDLKAEDIEALISSEYLATISSVENK